MTPSQPSPSLRFVAFAPAAMQAAWLRWAGARGGIAVGTLPAVDTPALQQLPGIDGGLRVFTDRRARQVEQAATSADLLLIDFAGQQAVEEAAWRARYALAAAGRSIEQLRIVVRLAVVAARTIGQAAELAEALPLDRVEREHAVVGSHAAAAAVLARLAASGAVDAIDISPVLGAGEVSEIAVEAIVSQLAPRLEALGVTGAGEPLAGLRGFFGLSATGRRAGARVPYAAFSTPSKLD